MMKATLPPALRREPHTAKISPCVILAFVVCPRHTPTFVIPVVTTIYCFFLGCVIQFYIHIAMLGEVKLGDADTIKSDKEDTKKIN